MNPEELINICTEKLQRATELIDLQNWTDGTHPQTIHHVNLAKANALVAIGLALQAIAEGLNRNDQPG